MILEIALGIMLGVVFSISLLTTAFLIWAVLKLSKFARDDDLKMGRVIQSDKYYRQKIVCEIKERLYKKVSKFVFGY